MSTVNQSIGVSFNTTGIFVGFRLYDWSGGSPVLIPGPDNNVFPMISVFNGAYGAVFQRDPTKTYQAVYNVYTDGTYATLDTSGNFATGEIDYPIESGGGTGGGGSSSSGLISLAVVQATMGLSIKSNKIVLSTDTDIII